MSVTLKRKVAISFQATTFRAGEMQAISAFSVDGDLYIKDEQTYLCFQEGELCDQEAVHTTLKWDGTTLLFMRRGAVTMRQPFMDGQATHGRYVTTHLSCETNAETEQLAVQLPIHRGENGHVHVRYRLWLQDQETGVHEIRMTIKDQAE